MTFLSDTGIFGTITGTDLGNGMFLDAITIRTTFEWKWTRLVRQSRAAAFCCWLDVWQGLLSRASGWRIVFYLSQADRIAYSRHKD